jgi:hypothetical protein
MTTIERAYSGAEKTQHMYARLAGFLFLWLIVTGLAGALTISHARYRISAKHLVETP